MPDVVFFCLIVLFFLTGAVLVLLCQRLMRQ